MTSAHATSLRLATLVATLIASSLAGRAAHAQDDAAPAAVQLPFEVDGEDTLSVYGYADSPVLVFVVAGWHGGCLEGVPTLYLRGSEGRQLSLEAIAFARSADGASLYYVSRVELPDDAAARAALVTELGGDSAAIEALAFGDGRTDRTYIGRLGRVDLAALTAESTGLAAGASLVFAEGTVYTAAGLGSEPSAGQWRPLDPAAPSWGAATTLPGERDGLCLFAGSADPRLELRYQAEAGDIEEAGVLWPDEGETSAWQLRAGDDAEGELRLFVEPR